MLAKLAAAPFHALVFVGFAVAFGCLAVASYALSAIDRVRGRTA